MAVTLRSAKGSALTHNEMDNNFSTLDKGVSEGVSTTLLSGGEISINADPTKFDIAAGTGRIVDASVPSSITYTNISWGAFTAQTATLLNSVPSTFLSIDSGGNVVQSASFPAGAALRTQVQLGSIVHSDLATITGTSQFTSARGFQIAVSLTELIQALGVINFTGNKFSGDPLGNLKLFKSEGTSFYFGFQRDPLNPNLIVSPEETAPTFISTWRDGAGGFSFNQVDAITAGVYDADTGGAGAPNGVLATNTWTSHRILFSPDAATIGVAYGQATYATPTEALTALPDEDFVFAPSFAGVPTRAALIVRGGAADLTDSGDATFHKTTKLGEF